MDVKNATKFAGYKFGGSECRMPIFRESEWERAETIMHALEGMSIASAQELLSKINELMLETLLT